MSSVLPDRRALDLCAHHCRGFCGAAQRSGGGFFLWSGVLSFQAIASFHLELAIARLDYPFDTLRGDISDGQASFSRRHGLGGYGRCNNPDGIGLCG
jgi:hypothetical protein